jgi:hypothetical protein
MEVAMLEGFDIAFSPSATLVPSTGYSVYGVIVELTQTELDRLYAPDWLKDYKPRSVTVKRKSREDVDATCYIAPPRPNAVSKPDYVALLIDTARAYGFPPLYVERLRKAGRVWEGTWPNHPTPPRGGRDSLLTGRDAEKIDSSTLLHSGYLAAITNVDYSKWLMLKSKPGRFSSEKN